MLGWLGASSIKASFQDQIMMGKVMSGEIDIERYLELNRAQMYHLNSIKHEQYPGWKPSDDYYKVERDGSKNTT